MEFSHDWFSSFWLAIHFSACFLTVLLFLETISAECVMWIWSMSLRLL
jgi:hypothetical protein